MNWKTFKEYFPYVSVCFIILTLAKQLIYYEMFNLPILDFIGASELLLAFADKLTLIFVGTFFIMFSLILIYDQKIIANSETSSLTKFIKTYLWAVIILVSGVVTVIFWHNDSVLYFFMGFCLSFGFPFVVELIRKIIFQFSGKVIERKYFFVASTVVVLGLLLFSITFIEVARVKKGYYFHTKIYTKDSTYISDSSHFYIGKTQNYYFIHNRDSTNMVIPEREVTKFDLKTNTIK